MKRMTFTLVVMLIATATRAQWNQSGSTLTTTGNVGIGTSTLSGKLQIIDNHLDIYTSQGLSNGWTKDGLTISANPDINYSSVRINSDHSPVADRGVLNVTRSASSLFYVRTDGNIGIGTTNPSGKLQIIDNHLDIYTSQGLSNGWTKDGLTISANPDINYSSVRINSNHSPVADRGVLNVTRSASSLFYVRTDGNIGIGTTNPSGKLQIIDNHLDIYTSQGFSNGWTKDGLTISANPDINYSSVRINSDHSPVADRGVLNVTRSASSLFYVRTDGNIGIGTTNPSGKLQIIDNHLDIYTSQGFSNGWTKDGLTISANPDINYSSVRINSDHSPVADRGVLNVTRSASSLFYVRTDGNIGIGTTDPKNKLSVNGTIWATEVKVSLIDGADWVFEDDYKLRTLEEVEEFIQKNKHLPEIPSAEDFRQNHLNVAEMDNKLLQKIEELTLYMIDMNKRVKELETENQELKEKVQSLEN